MDLVVACGAIGAVIGVAVGAAAGYARDQKANTRHILAAYEHVLADPIMSEGLVNISTFRKCDPETFEALCEACNNMSDINRLAALSTVDKSIRFDYHWRFKAFQYKKEIYNHLGTLSRAVTAWSNAQLARRHSPAAASGKNQNTAGLQNDTSKSAFAQHATELCRTVDNYYNNMIMQQS